jgi:hypothetical protein
VCIYIYIYVGDSEIYINILLCDEYSVSSDEEENVGNSSIIRRDAWAKSGAEQLYFPYTGEPGVYVDFEDRSNLL